MAPALLNSLPSRIEYSQIWRLTGDLQYCLAHADWPGCSLVCDRQTDYRYKYLRDGGPRRQNDFASGAFHLIMRNWPVLVLTSQKSLPIYSMTLVTHSIIIL